MLLFWSVTVNSVWPNEGNTQQTSRNSSRASFQEEKCKNEIQDDRLQKVHEQLEVIHFNTISMFSKSQFYVKEARQKVAAQADVLSAGYEHIVRPPVPGVSGRTDTRSRSVETSPCHRPNQSTSRYDNLVCLIFRNNISQIISRRQRERSLQDIDKDIETIWKELQELDKPRTSGESCEIER